MRTLLLYVAVFASLTSMASNIKVGYVGGSSLVDITGGVVHGTEVDIIRSALSNSVVEFIQYDNVYTMLGDIGGVLDIGAGGVSMTPDRVKCYNFTVPTDVNIITGCYMRGGDVRLSSKLNKVIINSLLQLFVILTVFALSIWSIERYNNDDSNFNKSPLKGITDGYWWSLVTASTVGYGDLVPKTVCGRLLGGLIIIIGVTWFGFYTGSIGGAYLTTVHGDDMVVGVDLHSPITLKHSLAEIELAKRGVDMTTFASLDDCISALRTGVGDCVIFDSNKLKKYIDTDSRLIYTNEELRREYVGLVYSDTFDRVSDINSIICMKFKGDI